MQIAACMALTLLLAPTFALPSSKKGQWGIQSHRIEARTPICLSQWGILESLRAGATLEEVEVDTDEEEEVDSDDEETDSDDEEEDYDDDDDDDEETSSSGDEEDYESAVEEEVDVSIEEYDKQLTPPPGLQMGGLLGVMLLARRIDMFNPKVVRFARYASVLTHVSFLAKSIRLSHFLSRAASSSSCTLLHNKPF